MAQAIPVIIAVVAAVADSADKARQLDAEAKAQEYNAKANQINAENAYKEGNAAEDALRSQTAQYIGNQRATLAQAGLAGSPTAFSLLAKSTAEAELDALNTRFSYSTQALNFLNQSKLNKFAAKTAKQGRKNIFFTGIAKAGAAGYNAYQNSSYNSKSNAAQDLSTRKKWEY
ncbi:MAG: hypothetical protein LBL00_05995 [Endomicrobium sp.]|jgi:hypothetical protein|nr:hypothetical protein [Endomicrobium sp.]